MPTGEVAVSVRVREAIRDPVDGFDHADCQRFTGDAVRQRVQWKGGRSMTELEGKLVRLDLFLQNADLTIPVDDPAQYPAQLPVTRQ